MPDTLSADARIVRLETVRPTDAARLRRLSHEAGELSRHLRFFSLGRPTTDAEVARLTRPTGSASYERLEAADAEPDVLARTVR